MRRQEWGLQHCSHLPFFSGYHSIRCACKVATLPRRAPFLGVQRFSESAMVRPLPHLLPILVWRKLAAAEHLTASCDTYPWRTLQDIPADCDVVVVGYPVASS